MGEGEEIHVAEDERVNISLKDLSKKLEEFAKARDWEKYHSPRNLLLAMVINLSHYFCLNIYIFSDTNIRTFLSCELSCIFYYPSLFTNYNIRTIIMCRHPDEMFLLTMALCLFYVIFAQKGHANLLYIVPFVGSLCR